MFAATPQLAPLRLYLNDIKIRSQKLIESACDAYRPELHYMLWPRLEWL